MLYQNNITINPYKVPMKTHYLSFHVIRVTSKYFLDNLQVLIGDQEYRKIRDEKMKAYQGTWNRVNFAIKYMNLVNFQRKKQFYDDIKSMTVKIIQLILLENNEYEYTKEGLANRINKLFPGNYDAILFLLFRGRRGSFDQSCLSLLISEFIRIARSINQTELQWNNVNIDIDKTPTKLCNELYNQFISSPFEPSKIFAEEFVNIFSTETPIDIS